MADTDAAQPVTPADQKSEVGDAGGGGSSGAASQMHSWYERIVVLLVLAVALGVAIAAGIGLFKSAGITAFFMGIAAATLAYHFLGGIQATWASTGVKLGGALAALAAISGITYASIKTDFDKQFQQDEVLKKQLEKRDAVLRQKDESIRKLQEQIRNVPDDSTERWLQVVEQTGPEDRLGMWLIDIQENLRGPWRRVVESKEVEISFHKKAEKDGKRMFTACSDLGLDGAGRRVRFAINDSATPGDSEPVEAESAGTLAWTNCKGDDADRVQLSCESALLMVPDFATGCTATGEVKWAPGKDKRRFPGSAEILRR
jgi:hypothetical protein